jgi:4-carboxymuconolactone decarboxylase
MTDDAPAPRLAPLPRARWDDDAIDALHAAYPKNVVEQWLSTAPDARPVPTAIATMLHHPALAGPWLAYNNVLLWSPALDDRLRELMVLRVAWRTRSKYEWVQHVKLSERYGVTSDDVDAVATGTGRDAWTPLERDLVAATDELLDDSRIADDTWTRLAEQLDERQLVELVFVVGTYTCLAMVFNSFGLQLDGGIDTSGMPLPPE